jgi:hypothetical protein
MIDSFESGLVVVFGSSFHLHDLPDGINQLVLKFACGFDVLDLLEEQYALHLCIERINYEVVLGLLGLILVRLGGWKERGRDMCWELREVPIRWELV